MSEWYRTGSLQRVGNRFAHQFPGPPVPVKSTIWKKVDMFYDWTVQGTQRQHYVGHHKGKEEGTTLTTEGHMEKNGGS